MNLVYKTRVVLIRFAKIFPFLLCALVFISYTEDIIALVCENYLLLDDSIVLNKPVSLLIGGVFVYDWYTIGIALVLSISMETCWYNKASIVYLIFNMGEKSYFLTIELYPEYIYIITILNLLISGFFVFKGFKILISK